MGSLERLRFELISCTDVRLVSLLQKRYIYIPEHVKLTNFFCEKTGLKC